MHGITFLKSYVIKKFLFQEIRFPFTLFIGPFSLISISNLLLRHMNTKKGKPLPPFSTYILYKCFYPSSVCIFCLYAALRISSLLVTEGFSKYCLALSSLTIRTFSNFFLYFFRALSIESPSFTGIINIISFLNLKFRIANVDFFSIVQKQSTHYSLITSREITNF